MHAPLLSAVLIVRDEADVLGDCLASICDTVDEIVVVDTGSVDGSPAIADSFGARRVDRPWTDDFAAARNAGLNVARGEWILYIDADERLRRAGDTVRALLESTDAPACTVLFHQRPGWTAYREHRLFRNDPRIRFEGAIHETIRPSLAALDEPIAHSTAVIDHFGYEGDRTRKWLRNLPILEREVQRTPDRVYLWHDLGWALHGLGRTTDADAAWQQGVRAAASKPQPEPSDIAPFLDLLVTRMTSGRSIDGLFEGAERCDRDNLALLWLRARWHLDHNRPGDALEIATRLAAVDPDALDGAAVGYERVLFEATAPAAVALCLFQLGRFAESADAYERLARCTADPALAAECRAKAVVARARAGSH